MSTKYFILSKPKNTNISDNTQNQIVVLNPQSEIHVLPKINLEYYVQHGLFENLLIEWCKQFCRTDSIFLDIGAHSGTYSISLAGVSNRVYAFEPQRMTYYALCGSVALSGIENIYCMNFGLGSPVQTGRQSLKIVSNDGGGSSLHSDVGVLREEIVDIITLDSMELSNIGFIKMDVEENELYVLQGALETLERSGWPPILFESNGENRALFEFIRNEGYQIIPVGGCNNMFLACEHSIII
jgi:FkbM family methyltransferase